MAMAGGTNDPVVLATAGYDHTIRFWQAHSGMCHRTVQHPDSQVNALEITPDKQLIAAAGYQHIRMYDLNSANPNPVINYNGITKNVTAVGFHEDGRWMFTGGEDNTARIWDLRSRNLQCQRIFQVNAPVNCVCLHPNQMQSLSEIDDLRGQYFQQKIDKGDKFEGELIVGDQGGSIHIWDLKTDNNENLIPEPGAAIQSISIDPMGTIMAAVSNKGMCYIWTLTGGRRSEPTKIHPKKKFQAHNTYALKCLFSPDSTLLATTSADQTCCIWRTADLTLLTKLREPNQRWVWDCAFSGDSQYIITASSDNTARLWSVDGGDVKREYSGHQKAVVCLAFRDEVVT